MQGQQQQQQQSDAPCSMLAPESIAKWRREEGRQKASGSVSGRERSTGGQDLEMRVERALPSSFPLSFSSSLSLSLPLSSLLAITLVYTCCCQHHLHSSWMQFVSCSSTGGTHAQTCVEVSNAAGKRHAAPAATEMRSSLHSLPPLLLLQPFNATYNGSHRK